MSQQQQEDIQFDYKYGFSMPEKPVFKSKKGLDESVIRQISQIKEEPAWMLEFRLKSYKVFLEKKMPTWGGDLSKINFDDIYYYLRSTEKQVNSWEDLPAEIKETYDRIGVPEAEKKFLAGVSAQYESEVVYESISRELEKDGVIFCDMDTGLRKYPDIVKEYFGTLIPPHDNKFAALNSAVWSGSSFVYVPKGVKVKLPLQAYFRINSERFGQFERTLIIA
ncbi:Fe-S cluster assembly protein SufB, partial [Candidatus Woesebacteria bacterium]|nr:Fe-S cluster assembly protein SufB [Candidatus Woesebacteria bacterium]